MFIRIKTSFHDFTLNFNTIEELKKIYLAITDALVDSTNKKGVVYISGEMIQLFPGSLLKNSVIEVNGLLEDEKNNIIIF